LGGGGGGWGRKKEIGGCAEGAKEGPARSDRGVIIYWRTEHKVKKEKRKKQKKGPKIWGKHMWGGEKIGQKRTCEYFSEKERFQNKSH